MCKLLHILFVLRFNKQDKSFLKKNGVIPLYGITPFSLMLYKQNFLLTTESKVR